MEVDPSLQIQNKSVIIDRQIKIEADIIITITKTIIV